MRLEAERFCALIEQPASMEREAFVAELAEALAGLLRAATCLPHAPPLEAHLPGDVSQAQWAERFAEVRAALGDWNSYWTTLAPYGEKAEEAVFLPLCDDLADIWRDLKRGLIALEGGAALQDVHWEWRFDFYSHWGRHATESLRALHARLAEAGGPSRRD